jgi:hypothetical protein
MKAILYPFGPDEPIVGLVQDFPQLQWTIAAAPGDIAREIGDAAILVTSNRVCSAAYGEALGVMPAKHCDGSISPPRALTAACAWGCRAGRR